MLLPDISSSAFALPYRSLAIGSSVYCFMPVPPPQVLLDVAAIQPDRILLLDTYFMVVVFYGATVAEWRRAGYHEQPEHQAFRSARGPCLALCLSGCIASGTISSAPEYTASLPLGVEHYRLKDGVEDPGTKVL